MQQIGTKQIETERLILRKYKVTDAEDMFVNWASCPAVTRFLTWPPYRRASDVRLYIKSRITEYEHKDCYDWVIEWKENHQVIGSISVISVQEMTQSASVGYCLGEAYWGKGIMTEALKAVVRFLFTEVGFKRIEATHDVRNTASGRVMEKCGLQYEGTLRQAGFANQGVCDIVVRSILKKDYQP